MAKHQFQTEVNRLLDLMIHSLYSNKEIFLRELVSNSSDALDKLKYLSMTEDKYKNIEFAPKIVLEIDKDKKVLQIVDNGIGMNDEDLVENLGTIAKSGTKSFIENLSGDKKKDSQLIGQFGVGFYSAFMVADKIEVVSRKAGEEKAFRWVSEGKGDYEISEASRDSQGTTVTLYLKEDESEFLESWRLKSIIKKYSNHIPFPIFATKEDKDKKEEEQLNAAQALWRMGKSEIKDEDYKEFYSSLSHDSDEPLFWMHNKVEGTLEYTTLFYIPKKAPMDLYRVDYQPGVKLYVKRVFITDDEKELMPTYMRFLRGVIDSEDLPLNVSREILQHNKIMANIKSGAVKKVLSELEKLAENNVEKYNEFYKEFGRLLKEGAYTDFTNREKLMELLRFKSTKSEGMTSLKEYKLRMKSDQKSIFYIIGEDSEILKNSPLVETFKKQDIEVLLLDDEIDNIVIPALMEYDKTPIKAVSSKDAGEEVGNKIDAGEEKKFKDLLEVMKEELKDEVKDVKVSSRLTDSPACIVVDESDPDFAMAKMMKQFGGGMDIPEPKPILEINPSHDILNKLLLKNDPATTKDVAHLLLDQARLVEGIKIKDIIKFNQRLNRYIHLAI